MRDNHTIQSMSETVEIDLVAVIWRMLRQWKCVLLVAIIFGLLASVALHMRAVGGAEQMQAAAAEVADEDRQAVETILLEEEQLEDVLTYLDESKLMKDDPHALVTLELQYYIEPEGDLPARERALLRRAYVNEARSEAMYEALSAAGVIDADCPRDIVSVYYELESEEVLDNTEATSRSDAYAITITLDEEMDPDEVEMAVTDFLSGLTTKLAERFGAHRLEKLYAFTSGNASYDISSRKYGLIQQAYNLRSQIKSMKDALTDVQMTYYEEMTAEEGMRENEEVAPAAPAAQPSSAGWFSKKYFAVGFVLGIVLYAIFLVLHMMRRRRIESVASLGAAGYRIFGDVYRYGSRSPLTDSRFFYGLAHRGRTDVQNALDRIGDAVAATAEHADIREISLMPLGDASKISDLLDALKKGLADAGITASVTPLYADGKDGGSDQAFLHQKPVVPVVIGEKTTTEMVDAIAGRCAHYDVDLLGVIYAG